MTSYLLGDIGAKADGDIGWILWVVAACNNVLLRWRSNSSHCSISSPEKWERLKWTVKTKVVSNLHESIHCVLFSQHIFRFPWLLRITFPAYTGTLTWMCLPHLYFTPPNNQLLMALPSPFPKFHTPLLPPSNPKKRQPNQATIHDGQLVILSYSFVPQAWMIFKACWNFVQSSPRAPSLGEATSLDVSCSWMFASRSSADVNLSQYAWNKLCEVNKTTKHDDQKKKKTESTNAKDKVHSKPKRYARYPYGDIPVTVWQCSNGMPPTYPPLTLT